MRQMRVQEEQKQVVTMTIMMMMIRIRVMIRLMSMMTTISDDGKLQFYRSEWWGWWRGCYFLMCGRFLAELDYLMVMVMVMIYVRKDLVRG